ncbi:hypothetical protein SELMODRAFT_135030 [Selaginella moellendorffii]|uniref:DYW domain-containing protein n=1 Tax=Selaginella moellendorffii TaxID=88036 RepID=D8T9L3_SELML|nr:hypothetical protein SELMODRAFT_135030 [Selaginella moellendorffii]
MYGKCGSLDDARAAFHSIPGPNIFSWSIMLGASIHNRDLGGARRLFEAMPRRDAVTWNAMISAYTERGEIDRSRAVMDRMPHHDVVSWTSILLGHANCLDIAQACRVFQSMPARNEVSWATMLQATAQIGELADAEAMFARMPARTIVHCSSMLSVYARKGHLRKMEKLYEQMPEWDAMSQALLVCRYAQLGHKGHLVGAKKTFDSMAADEQDVVSWTAMMAAYAQSGRLDEAVAVFEDMPWRDVAAWNAAVAALAHCGQGKESVGKFQRMIQEGVAADEISFVSVLTGCSREGLLASGREIFTSMSADFAIQPGRDHYGCMVDLLGRSGELADAEDLMGSMPFVPEIVTWMALLGACKNHRSEEIGARIAHRIIELDAANPTTYVLLAGLYASIGKREKAEAVREEMRKNKKGSSATAVAVIEIDGKQHRLVAGEWRSHPRSGEIEAELERLERSIQEAGYKPDDLQLGEEEGVASSHHSERLAIALGMIATPSATTLRIVKNVRVCADCHAAAKIIARISGRKIVVRDSSRFHYFDKGQCSCQDYW